MDFEHVATQEVRHADCQECLARAATASQPPERPTSSSPLNSQQLAVDTCCIVKPASPVRQATRAEVLSFTWLATAVTLSAPRRRQSKSHHTARVPQSAGLRLAIWHVSSAQASAAHA